MPLLIVRSSVECVLARSAPIRPFGCQIGCQDCSRKQCRAPSDVFGTVRARRAAFREFRRKERSVQNRTPVSLRFLITLPSVEARGRWRERGRVPPGPLAHGR